ncbi:hypothetical protein EDB80DRAFT_683319 [Ilyonectria destructans]|nr:hypothetical protein EDB80DRAFT_683319 [Ilyonectria destructans]
MAVVPLCMFASHRLISIVVSVQCQPLFLLRSVWGMREVPRMSWSVLAKAQRSARIPRPWQIIQNNRLPGLASEMRWSSFQARAGNQVGARDPWAILNHGIGGGIAV